MDRYQEQFIRSFRYAGFATLLAFVIGYPLAYFIAWRAGRFKNYFLFLVVLPFFTTYLIRTLAWQTILSDEGNAVTALRDLGIMDVLDTLHISQNGRLLATPTAVVTAITYNLLPFMVLPIYVSLERIDRRLVEAAHDLYGGPIRAFLRVVFPLSLPGVFAGTLLTFIPAAGDFVNAALLGSPNTTMIGNVIQSRFLVLLRLPLGGGALVHPDGHHPHRRGGLRASAGDRGDHLAMATMEAAATQTRPAWRCGPCASWAASLSPCGPPSPWAISSCP